MARTIPLAKREQLVKDWQSTGNYAEVARKHKVAYHTVRTLCKRFESEGKAGLQTRYGNCGPKRIKSDPLMHRTSLWLKRLHPQWGAPFIRMKLKQRYADRIIPSERSLQVWFRAAKLNVPKTREPRQGRKKASAVHESWQMDGKEEQNLKNQEDVCWLTIVDQYSGGLISAKAFSKKEFTMSLFQPC